jgi:hypothetical protein
LPGTQFNTEPTTYFRDGFLYGKYNSYVKNKKIYYYYPKELNFVSASHTITSHDANTGLVIFDTTGTPYLTLSTTGVAAGTYTAPRGYQELKMYDGTIVRVDGTQLKITVIDPSTLGNKSMLG